MKKQYIIPIFVPHLGCPNDCTFCNQKSISGQIKKVTESDVRETIEYYLNSFKEKDAYKEVAFFGGSFTGIEVEEQEKTKDIIDYEYSITQNRINMIKYVSEQGSGYIKDLKAQDAFNGRTVDEFMSMGFINTGFTSQEKTWSKTQLLDDYAKDLGVIKEG